MAKITKDEQAKAREQLRRELKPGDTVYTVLRRVAPSGMTRWIDLYKIEDGTPHWLSYRAAEACGFTFDTKRESIKVGGCGMDMGFHLVYELSSVLFRGAFDCVGESCPSNDHSNGDRDRTPHAHSDGGYALRQRWL